MESSVLLGQLNATRKIVFQIAWTLEGLCETQSPPVSSGDVALAISTKHIAYNITFKLYTLVLFQPESAFPPLHSLISTTIRICVRVLLLLMLTTASGLFVTHQ